MTDALEHCRETLIDTGFDARHLDMLSTGSALAFENNTVLGFIVLYENFDTLFTCWRTDIDKLFETHRFSLRRAGEKAWNAYAILLCRRKAEGSQAVALGTIDEDLVGCRKITCAGIKDAVDVRNALLPLLPLQSPPRLDAVNMADEIRLRTQELGARVVTGFLADADEGVMLKVLEEDP
jgi:hypothetical protein